MFICIAAASVADIVGVVIVCGVECCVIVVGGYVEVVVVDIVIVSITVVDEYVVDGACAGSIGYVVVDVGVGVAIVGDYVGVVCDTVINVFLLYCCVIVAVLMFVNVMILLVSLSPLGCVSLIAGVVVDTIIVMVVLLFMLFILL